MGDSIVSLCATGNDPAERGEKNYMEKKASQLLVRYSWVNKSSGILWRDHSQIRAQAGNTWEQEGHESVTQARQVAEQVRECRFSLLTPLFSQCAGKYVQRLKVRAGERVLEA